MKLKVDGVNKAKTGFVSNETWYNQANRKDAPQFGDLKRGDEIEVELNGDTTFVKSFKVLLAQAAIVKSTTKPGYKTDPEDAARMGRVKVLGDVLTSPYVASLLSTMDRSQADSEIESRVNRYVNYVNTGKFSDNQNGGINE